LLVIVSFSFLVFTLKLWIGVYNIVILGTDGRTVSSCFFVNVHWGDGASFVNIPPTISSILAASVYSMIG
jgi:hypothetical protein